MLLNFFAMSWNGSDEYKMEFWGVKKNGYFYTSVI